ncbi:MAG TPA: GntR family transcriptional regulator [Nocardioidaceae bacterium]|nr:GntR family transcriptional regulator [Nocardioidaceae bacterium]
MARGIFPDLSPVDRPGPLRHRVLEALRELIVVRTLAPGQHLVESELAERLNVSRGPVREALQALATQGWVDLRPGRGAFVHEPSDEEAEDVFAVRTALESEAARLAASRVTADHIAELRETCARGRAAVAAGDVPTVVAENSALHHRVAELAGVTMLYDYIDSLDQRVRWFYQPLVRRRGLASWDEHDELIAALEAHDVEKAGQVMRWHTSQTLLAYHNQNASGPSERVDGSRPRTAKAGR